MKKRLSLLSALTIAIYCACCAQNRLAAHLGDYSTLERANLVNTVRILQSDTIAFVDMDSLKSRGALDMFYYTTPDTVWIKKRPKKNPKVMIKK